MNALVQDHPPVFAGIGPLSWSGAPDFRTLATTLIGSGGTGISAAESAQLVARP